MTGTGARVECRGLVHVYRAAGTDVAALRGIDLTVPPGQHLALLGPSGSGKSTLMSLLSGMRQPSAGAILVDGRDIARLPEGRLRDYRAHVVGTLLQGGPSNLLPYASALENVAYARRARARGTEPRPAAELLASLGLDRTAQRTPVEDLSPSGQQLAAAAVALANDPALFVADEPTSQLDPATRDAVLDAVIETTSAIGTTVVVVTHDRAVAARMERVVYLDSGRVGEEGHADERFAVLGVDRAVHLPAHLVEGWRPGSRVRVSAVSPDEIRLTRVDE